MPVSPDLMAQSFRALSANLGGANIRTVILVNSLEEAVYSLENFFELRRYSSAFSHNLKFVVDDVFTLIHSCPKLKGVIVKISIRLTASGRCTLEWRMDEEGFAELWNTDYEEHDNPLEDFDMDIGVTAMVKARLCRACVGFSFGWVARKDSGPYWWLLEIEIGFNGFIPHYILVTVVLLFFFFIFLSGLLYLVLLVSALPPLLFSRHYWLSVKCKA